MQWAAIGAAHLDRIARALGPVTLGSSNPAEVAASPGGVARNVAETLARLGSSVRLVSRLGDDEAGRSVLAATETAGVDISGVEIVAGVPTAGYTALLDPAGRLVVAFADMAIYDGFDGATAAAAASGVSHWFADANLPGPALKILATRKPAGVVFAADAVSVAKSERLRQILAAIDLLFVNRDEARALTRCDEPGEAAARLLASGVGAVVVTSGADGALVADRAGGVTLPPAPVAIRDVTGAGDALIGATLDAIGRDLPLVAAVGRGLVAAAATLGYEGAVRPDLRDVLAAVGR